MRNSTITVLASLAGVLAIPAPASLAAPPEGHTGGKVTVRITGSNDNGADVTNGGVAGTGQFVASGAIKDRGTCVGYRTVKGAFITLRFVSAGTKGTITFVVSSTWISGPPGGRLPPAHGHIRVCAARAPSTKTPITPSAR